MIEELTCLDCSGVGDEGVVVRAPAGASFPFGCSNCGNKTADRVALVQRMAPKDEGPSVLERLCSARPKEVRGAALGYFYLETSELWQALDLARGSIRRAIHGEKLDSTSQEQIAQRIEDAGLLFGLLARLPAVSKRKFASVLGGCLALLAKVRGVEDSLVVREFAQRMRGVDAKERKFATFSPEADPAYRYVLGRVWDESKSLIIFVGLNPSTADAEEDDQTVRRWRGFAQREGAGGFLALNAYAFRSTDPDGLWATVDPVGPDNDEHIDRECRVDGRRVVVCWGENLKHGGARAGEVLDIIRMTGSKVFCFGTTKDGYPRHPLYLPDDAPIEVYPS